MTSCTGYIALPSSKTNANAVAHGLPADDILTKPGRQAQDVLTSLGPTSAARTGLEESGQFGICRVKVEVASQLQQIAIRAHKDTPSAPLQ